MAWLKEHTDEDRQLGAVYEAVVDDSDEPRQTALTDAWGATSEAEGESTDDKDEPELVADGGVRADNSSDTEASTAGMNEADRERGFGAGRRSGSTAAGSGRSYSGPSTVQQHRHTDRAAPAPGVARGRARLDGCRDRARPRRRRGGRWVCVPRGRLPIF